jgi:hypothetical protein
VAFLGRIEHIGEVLLRLADPLRDHARQISEDSLIERTMLMLRRRR